MPSLKLWLVLTVLTGCAQVAKLPPPSLVTRRECMKMAEAYRLHQWTASVANVRHGLDTNGIRVDTPDIAHKSRWQDSRLVGARPADGGSAVPMGRIFHD